MGMMEIEAELAGLTKEQTVERLRRAAAASAVGKTHEERISDLESQLLVAQLGIARMTAVLERLTGLVERNEQVQTRE